MISRFFRQGAVAAVLPFAVAYAGCGGDKQTPAGGPIDAADGGPVRTADASSAACQGSILDGSFVIRNVLDVQAIRGYAVVTGDITVEARGLATISLPALCSVGGEVRENEAPDLVTLDLPALTSAKGLTVQGAPLKTAHLERLERVTGDLSIAVDGTLSLAALRSSGTLRISGLAGTKVDVPRLPAVDRHMILYCLDAPPCGLVTASALFAAGTLDMQGMALSAPRLMTVGALALRAKAKLEAPGLVSIGESFSVEADEDNPAEFPSLASVGGDFGLATAVPSTSFPMLVSIAGNTQISGIGAAPSSVSLPVLRNLDGKVAGAARIDLAGSFHAPKVVSAKNGLVLTRMSSLDLSALTSVGEELTVMTAAATTSFPALTSIAGTLQISQASVAQSVSLPALGTVEGPAFIDVGGTFAAPALVTAKDSLVLRHVSGLELPLLKTVGNGSATTLCGPTVSAWTVTLDVDATTLVALHLPALESACLLLGTATGLLACGSGNLSLTQVMAPRLSNGGVQLFNNPLLPKCRAEALAAQISHPVPPADAKVEYCPLAPGPCP